MSEVGEMSAASRGYAVSGSQRLAAALDLAMREEYQRGLTDGLAVARRIRDWLTRQPDREWQRQVREWADAEISNAERPKA